MKFRSQISKKSIIDTLLVKAITLWWLGILWSRDGGGVSIMINVTLRMLILFGLNGEKSRLLVSWELSSNIKKNFLINLLMMTPLIQIPSIIVSIWNRQQ